MKKRITTVLAALLAVLLLVLFGGPETDVSAPTEIAAWTQEEAPAESETPPQEELPPETEAREQAPPETTASTQEEAPPIAKEGSYTTKEDVALYIHTYGCLPENFMTKNEARELGWEGGGLEDYAPGMCIGGDRFGNYEGLLPEAQGRRYTECDIDTLGKDKRGAKRIVFSNDGLIYYTDDHYESFELLYGEP